MKMKAVRVKYTVKPEYVETNKENIRKVMEVLKRNPIKKMQYASFLLDDGQTFIHINMAEDQATLDKLQELEEFGQFRMALKASEPISPPQSENLNLVAAGFELS